MTAVTAPTGAPVASATAAPPTEREAPSRRGALELSERVCARVLGELLRRERATVAKPDVEVTAHASTTVEARAEIALRLPDGPLQDTLATLRRNIAPEFERQTGRRLTLLDLTVSGFEIDRRARSGRVR